MVDNYLYGWAVVWDTNETLSVRNIISFVPDNIIGFLLLLVFGENLIRIFLCVLCKVGRLKIKKIV